ncbi:hypothetical protein [Caudoviricetes sp.]|nr:hypothetical protein [Caudoviricetes sp.]
MRIYLQLLQHYSTTALQRYSTTELQHYSYYSYYSATALQLLQHYSTTGLQRHPVSLGNSKNLSRFKT